MTTSTSADLNDPRAWIRDVPDFPKPGILFKDITPLLGYPPAFDAVIERLADAFRDRSIETVAAAEARVHLRRAAGAAVGRRFRADP